MKTPSSGESFAEMRQRSRMVDQHKPEVIERKRGGRVPPQAKLVGPVIRGKAAEREMQRMEKQAAADDADDKPVKKRLDRPVKRATGGAVPSRTKMVGPVIRGKAAEREMRAMEDEAHASKSSGAKKDRPIRRATGGAVSWLPEGAGASGFPYVPNSPPTPIAPTSTPLPANQGRNANAAASQMLNAAGAAGLRATASLNALKPLKTS